jgi:hypothetical protein
MIKLSEIQSRAPFLKQAFPDGTADELAAYIGR